MSTNKEVFAFLTTLSLFRKSMERVFAFLNYTASFILVTATAFSKPNLFWGCANGFVNFLVHIMILTQITISLRFLNFTDSFVEVNVDVIYDGSCSFSELMIKSKSGNNGSNKNAVFFCFFHSFIC